MTSVTRTLLDLCSVIGYRQVEAALLDAIRRRLTSLEGVRRALRHSAPGRRGIRRLRTMIRDLGPEVPESILEARVLRMLREAGLPRPSLQHPVRDGARMIARLDFAYPEAEVGIEADGFRYHGSRPAWQRDLTRRKDLAARGWRILHITWADLEQPERFVATLQGLLGAPGQVRLDVPG